MQELITVILAVLGVYLAIGVVFAIPFAVFGLKSVDPGAVAGTWGFKLLILPGSAVFWPYLLKRWISKSPPPAETSAHRRAAGQP